MPTGIGEGVRVIDCSVPLRQILSELAQKRNVVLAHDEMRKLPFHVHLGDFMSYPADFTARNLRVLRFNRLFKTKDELLAMMAKRHGKPANAFALAAILEDLLPTAVDGPVIAIGFRELGSMPEQVLRALPSHDKTHWIIDVAALYSALGPENFYLIVGNR